ncbi:hypothetical protein [Kineococcus rhizosphaerae]|uniref:Uncharacterized protein n=1 Tax=Kineococcus rhizosphaerae TaxID=559628 RepID=A0A2T0QX67_9ACTN|nr:hypothetical protein [Kineococcus rhizosphaerae]PRY10472.1 hypothetical protein CLV37_11625 [Kineococcus rhizosphaerae]
MSTPVTSPLRGSLPSVVEPAAVIAAAHLVRSRARRARERARQVRAEADGARTTATLLRTRPVPVGAPPPNRALAVRGTLGDLWGAGDPPSPDPWLTLVVDALALDDTAGREHGLIVQGDAVARAEVTSVLVLALAAHPLRSALLDRLPGTLRAEVRARLASAEEVFGGTPTGAV